MHFPFKCRVVVASFCLCLTISALAHAQSPNQKIERFYRQALQSYFNLELHESLNSLKKALDVATASKIRNKTVANAHVLVGAVRHLLKEEDVALVESEFIEALRIDPTVTIHPHVANPKLEEILKRARVKARPVAYKLFHKPITKAEKDRDLFIHVQAQGSSNYKLKLHYRNDEIPVFTTVTMMKGSGDRSSSKIPGTLVAGKNLFYYIELSSQSGQVKKRSGSREKPHAVLVVASEENGEPPGRKWVAISLGPGAGAGVATGRSDRPPETSINPGFAPAPFHIWVDAMAIIVEAFELGLYARFQIVSKFDWMIGVKGKWYVMPSKPYRLFLSVGGGYGKVSHTVDLSEARGYEFVDTTTSGPGFALLGLGFIYNFTPLVGILVELQTLTLFTDFSFTMDLNVGVQLSF